jgi:hypothetical protein
VKQKSRSQQVIGGLAEWGAKASKSQCKLGREPPRRRGGACPACPPRQELEINGEISRLINLGAFKHPGICPYRVVVSHLLAGLMVGPESLRARSVRRLRIDPTVKIKEARKRIRSILYATGLSRDDIEGLSVSRDSPRWQALSAIATADRALEKALALLQSPIAIQTGRLRRGRAGRLHMQAIARAMARAWRRLTGRLPAKNSVRFHALLWGAIVSIFGHSVKKPNFESATRTAVDRIRQDAAAGS